MSEQAWRWGPLPPDDGITAEQLRPHGWAPGSYVCRACPRCGEQFGDCDKRSRSCRPCAVKAFHAVEAVRARALHGDGEDDNVAVAGGDAENMLGVPSHQSDPDRDAKGWVTDLSKG